MISYRGPKISVLIPSYRRPVSLARCLKAFREQSLPADEIIVVWQGDDRDTADATARAREELNLPILLVHCPATGIVPAENAGLGIAAGDIILLVDDDAIVPRDWIQRHISHYERPDVGAVGGVYINYSVEGVRFPERTPTKIGAISWLGRLSGNCFDHPDAWAERSPIEVDHVAGGNMSLRRIAFDRFEERLLPYWQFFEAEACLQVAGNGYRTYFDFSNRIQHYPTNSAFDGQRTGDLSIKVFHSAYNHAFVLGKHSPALLRPWRLTYLLCFGSKHTPGLLGFMMAARHYGNPRREASIFVRTVQWHIRGWRDGRRASRQWAEASAQRTLDRKNSGMRCG